MSPSRQMASLQILLAALEAERNVYQLAKLVNDAHHQVIDLNISAQAGIYATRACTEIKHLRQQLERDLGAAGVQP